MLSKCVHTEWMRACSVASDSWWPHGLWPARVLSPWSFPGKNTGVGCHFLLQGIFPTQGTNPYLLHLLHWHSESKYQAENTLSVKKNSKLKPSVFPTGGHRVSGFPFVWLTPVSTVGFWTWSPSPSKKCCGSALVHNGYYLPPQRFPSERWKQLLLILFAFNFLSTLPWGPEQAWERLSAVRPVTQERIQTITLDLHQLVSFLHRPFLSNFSTQSFCFQLM